MIEHEELKKLLREDINYSRKILESVEKTQRYILWLKILNIIKVVLILVPLLLAAIYLPPLFRQLSQTYGSIFEQIGKIRSGELQQVDPNVFENVITR